VKQLVSLVDRISYIGTCELLLPTEEVSLKSAVNCAATPGGGSSHGANPTIVDPRIVGALLERQLDSLEPSRWKESVHGVFVRLLRDALDVYHVEDDSSSGMPVRRARVLVRCMEFVYRNHGQDEWSALGFANVDEIGSEVERLVMMSVRFLSLFIFLVQFNSNILFYFSINLGPWEGYTISMLWCSISNSFTSVDGPPCTSACGSRTRCFDDPTCRRSLQVDQRAVGWWWRSC
jgi:separase